MELIRDFNKINKDDADIAGGKGASLGEITQSGIPVPPGFVILSIAFEKFLEETDLNVEIDSILHSVSHKEIHTIENASEKIKALILRAKMPKDIAKEIQKFFEKLNAKYVAVRSSATAEDSSTAAWAGQLESYLNTTRENLLENVKKCWASLFTPRAIFYRFEKELHKQKISVAVVIQKMIQSKVSGIAFSVHPVTQDRNQLIIEAGFGLGEAIVSGQITPDSYVVEKNPKRIIDKNVETQNRGLFRADNGGNEWQKIEEEQGQKQVLSDKQILELSEIVLNIENHYGFPCDIEWAFEKGKFYIVQSRPITTLTDDSSLFNIPPQINIFGKIPSVEEYPSDPTLEEKYFNYINTNQKWYPKGIKAHLLLMHPQGIAASAGVSATNKVGFRCCVATYEDKYMRWSYDPRDFISIGQMLVSYNEGRENYAKEYKEKFDKITASFAEKARDYYFNFKAKSIEEIKNAFIDIVNFALQAQSYGYLTEVFTITEDYWVIKYLKTIAPEIVNDDLQFLLQAIEPSFVKKFEYRLKIAKNKSQFEDILRDYFWVKGSYFTLPDLTIKTLQNERERLEETTFDYESIRKKKLEIIPQSKQRTKLKSFIEDVEYFIAIQDERKANVLRLNYAIKKLVDEAVKLSREWTVEELLSLTPLEFIAWCDGKISIIQKEEIDKRNHKSVWLFTNKGYLITTKERLVKTIFVLFDEKKSDVVSGYCASRGKVIGKVKIVFSEIDFGKIKDGDILVTSMTRPEFMPILKKAVAFVTDEGGITSHAAIISREMNKPCIIGTKNATQILKDGDLVEVDANNGVVRILEKKSKKLNIENYQRLFQWDGFIPFILSYDFVRGYIDLGGMAFSDKKTWLSYMLKSAMGKTLKEGLELYKSKNRYESYKNNVYQTFEKIEKTIRGIGKIKVITKNHVTDLLVLLKEYRLLYLRTEFFYTDLAFEKMKQFPVIRENFKSFEQLKIDGRSYLNKIFFNPDALFDRFIKKVSAQHNISYDDVLSYSTEELVQLFENKKVSKEVISQRQKAYVVYAEKENIRFFAGEQAEKFIAETLFEKVYSTILEGQIANRGKVTAKAKVIKISLSDYGKLADTVEEMEQGRVLVAETTEPAIIMACKKASAIVTNQGGMMSHAAIVSREMNIPCIVGTGIATDVIKDGDLVEVDANNGIVKILK